MDPSAGRKSFMDWLLAPFADVRAGESGTVLLLMLNVFLLFTAYYIIKPVREAFILQGGTADLFGWTVGKAEIKSYASAVMALLLVFVVKYYGRLASAVPRQKLITFVTLFFVGNLVVFFVLAKTTVSVWLAIAFFVWVGIFNNMVVAQFWAFANDVYTPDEGRRLFAIVGFGASFGAVGGAWIAGKIVGIGIAQMLLVGAALLAICIVFTNIVHRREAARRARRAVVATASEAEKPVGPGGGFQLVFNNRYLLLIALLILVANIVNSTGEFILGKKVSGAAADVVASGAAGGLNEGQWIGRFYSNYFLWVNILTAALQLFVVSRLLKYLGVRVALMVLPLVALGGYATLAFGAAIGLVRLVKIFENATDYSVQNTTRHALFLPTSREVKYKAKAAIDTFFVRIGDFASALLVFTGAALALSVEQFAVANLVLVAVWIALAVGVLRRYRGLAPK
jgi:AAA family ATP:ADP antiporter